MSKAIITESKLTDIANAIRTKGGTSANLTPDGMATAIAAIPTGSGWTKRAWKNDGWCHIWVDFTDITNKTLLVRAMFVAPDGIDVDWGDGSTAEHFSVSYSTETGYSIQHTFSADGPFEVKISGYTSISDNNHVPMFKTSENGTNYGMAVRQIEMGSASYAYGYAEAWSRFCGCGNLVFLNYGNGNASNETLNVFGNGARSLKGINFPSTIKTVGNYINFNAIEELTFDATTALSNFSASLSNTRIKSIEIPFEAGGVVSGNFNACQTLESVIFGEGLTTINSGNMFRSCPYLKNVTIPSTVTLITGDWMFYYTSYASDGVTLTVKATTPPTLSSSNVLSGTCVKWKKIIVPRGCLSSYQNATHWSARSSVMEEAEE